MNRLSVEQRTKIVALLCEGNSLRGTARVTKHSLKTVQRVLREVGDMAMHHDEVLAGLQPRVIQCDEQWSYVYCKEKTLKRAGSQRKGAGSHWIYVAVDPETKLILTYLIGKRTIRDSIRFMLKVRKKLLHTPDGLLARDLTIATDGFKGYPEAIEIAFGDEVRAGQMVKLYEDTPEGEEPKPNKRYVDSLKRILKGIPELKDITTWSVERTNQFSRNQDGRLIRQTIRFSKDAQYHRRQFALIIMFRNYCWQLCPQRPKQKGDPWIKRLSPAMHAGLADHIWDVEELVLLSDEYHRAGPAASSAEILLEALAESNVASPFWVFLSSDHQKAMVHHAHCKWCNSGAGTGRATSQRGRWLGFDKLKDALAFARQEEPYNYRLCTFCAGEGYNTLTKYGRRI